MLVGLLSTQQIYFVCKFRFYFTLISQSLLPQQFSWTLDFCSSGLVDGSWTFVEFTRRVIVTSGADILDARAIIHTASTQHHAPTIQYIPADIQMTTLLSSQCFILGPGPGGPKPNFPPGVPTSSRDFGNNFQSVLTNIDISKYWPKSQVYRPILALFTSVILCQVVWWSLPWPSWYWAFLYIGKILKNIFSSRRFFVNISISQYFFIIDIISDISANIGRTPVRYKISHVFIIQFTILENT